MNYLNGIKVNTERALAPFIAQLTRIVMKSQIPVYYKARLWQFANNFFFHHNVKAIGRNVLGNRINCRTGDFVQKHILVFDTWEPGLTQYLLAKGSVDGIFLDIGANIGYFSLLASQIFTKVIAFEPSPSICKALRDNLTLNEVKNVLKNISIHEVAVTEFPGEFAFYKSEDGNI